MPPHDQLFLSGKLIVNQLSCWRGYRRLFSNLNFTLNSGEVLALTGRNGIGKSSLLVVLAGLLQSYSGNISYNNRLITSQDVFWLGVTLPFYAQLALYDNLYFWAALNDQPRTAVDIILDTWQLTDCKYLHFNQLSRGQQQRAHLSRLILHHCPIWLLDEPLTGLDQQGLKIFHDIASCHLNKKGMIIIAPYATGWDTKILDIETCQEHS